MASDKTALDGLRIDRDTAGTGSGRWRTWAVLAVVALALGAAGWWWLGRPRAAEVRVATARAAASPAAAGAVLNASGYVTARRQATVSSKVTGKVVEILVEEGMAVRQGQVLARLDDASLRADLALAQAQLAAARKALDETRVRLEEAELKRRRMRSLSTQGVASDADVDAADAEADSLAARLALGREEVAVAERRVAVERQRLDDMVIRAPFSGVAISKDAQPGEMISPVSAGGGFTRTGICTLVDMDSLEVEVDVNEAYINRVEDGQKAFATLDAYPEWQIPAHVITTVPAADRQKATVKVRLGFDEKDRRILPDMGVKVAFQGGAGAAPAAADSRPAVLVPRRALRKDGETDVVLVVEGDRVERRAVGLSPAPGDEAVVLSGLAAGERVVIEGPQDLADGALVAVQE